MSGHYETIPGTHAQRWVPDAPIDPNGDPNQIANDWAASGEGKVSYGEDGTAYADPAPHGIMDRIAQYAPYGILGTMAAYNVAALPGLLGGGAPAAAGSVEAGGATTGAGAAAALGSSNGLGALAATDAARKGVMGAIHDAIPVATAGVNQYSRDAAANRGVKLTYAQEQEKLRQAAAAEYQRELLAREVENRNAENDAMERVQRDSYNMQRKAYVPPTVHSNVAGVKDQTLTNFGIGRTHDPTADEIAGYTADRDRTRDRLMSGSQLPPLTDPTQSPFYTQPNPNLDPSTMEKIAHVAGPGLSIWDKISKYL